MTPAPKEQPKTTEAIAIELTGAPYSFAGQILGRPLALLEPDAQANSGHDCSIDIRERREELR